jgi:hypothetical protein
MKIEFPDKETFDEMFPDGEKPVVPEGMDHFELMEMFGQALKIAVEEFPLEDYKPVEEYLGYNPYYQLDPATHQQLNIPSVMLTSDEGGVPILYLRMFRKDGQWLGEARCDLLSVVGFFAGKTLALLTQLREAGFNITDEEAREFAIRKTATLLKSAFAKLKDRIELTVDSFMEEVWFNWAEIWYEQQAEINSLQGGAMKRVTFKRQREALLKKHEDDLHTFWADDSSEKLSNLKKELLALHYEQTYEHWKEMQRMQTAGRNWRRYVRADDMSDVTDDLIEAFERGTDISGLALEHAARRAELYNVFDVREKRLEKRKAGIKDSGYSRSRLFKLKSEGEELLNKRLSESATE